MMLVPFVVILCGTISTFLSQYRATLQITMLSSSYSSFGTSHEDILSFLKQSSSSSLSYHDDILSQSNIWKSRTATTNENGEEEVKDLPTTPLNVLILYPDDWRHDDLGDANPELYTPMFTSLAAAGVRFTHNAVTTSICWISRATLFTGQYVSRHESTYLFRPQFAADASAWGRSWPALLQRYGGYWIGHIGKWQYRDADNYKRRLFNFSSYFEGWIVRHNDKTGGSEYIADLAGSEAIRFLRERPKDRPFAATIAFYPPKGIADPTAAKGNYTNMYRSKVFEEAYDRTVAYQRLLPFLQNNRTDARARYLYRYETDGDYHNATLAQYATLTHLDAVCGEIVQELKRQGVYDTTMIIVTADNGEFHGRHALADKWYPYEESIRVPLIIRDPRMSHSVRGTLNDEFALNIDLAPTILGAAGLSSLLPSTSMQGRDIADLYLPSNPGYVGPSRRNNEGQQQQPQQQQQQAHPWRKEFYYEFPHIQTTIPPSVALVRKHYKYIDWWFHGHEELFDLRNDPFELHNIANDTRWDALKREMHHRLHALRHEMYGSDHIPGTRCDPLTPAGTDLTKLPNCSKYFPDRCCPYPK